MCSCQCRASTVLLSPLRQTFSIPHAHKLIFPASSHIQARLKSRHLSGRVTGVASACQCTARPSESCVSARHAESLGTASITARGTRACAEPPGVDKGPFHLSATAPSTRSPTNRGTTGGFSTPGCAVPGGFSTPGCAGPGVAVAPERLRPGALFAPGPKRRLGPTQSRPDPLDGNGTSVTRKTAARAAEDPRGPRPRHARDQP